MRENLRSGTSRECRTRGYPDGDQEKRDPVIMAVRNLDKTPEQGEEIWACCTAEPCVRFLRGVSVQPCSGAAWQCNSLIIKYEASDKFQGGYVKMVSVRVTCTKSLTLVLESKACRNVVRAQHTAVKQLLTTCTCLAASPACLSPSEKCTALLRLALQAASAACGRRRSLLLRGSRWRSALRHRGQAKQPAGQSAFRRSTSYRNACHQNNREIRNKCGIQSARELL